MLSFDSIINCISCILKHCISLLFVVYNIVIVWWHNVNLFFIFNLCGARNNTYRIFYFKIIEIASWFQSNTCNIVYIYIYIYFFFDCVKQRNQYLLFHEQINLVDMQYLYIWNLITNSLCLCSIDCIHLQLTLFY